MTRVAIGLGSNLGNRLETLRSALTEIRRTAQVMGVSSLYETDPVGGPEQGLFLNAVVVVESDLEPLVLLERLIAIEAANGRVRDEPRGPRTLDLDIIAHRDAPLATDQLQIPHPRAHTRRFVLEPLVDVWPSAPVGKGLTAEAALSSVAAGGVFRFTGEWEIRNPTIGWRGPVLVLTQLVLIAAVAVAAFVFLEQPLTLVRTVTGMAVAAVGSVLVIGASWALGSNLSALPEPRAGAVLVEKGPFRLVRHPIYGGIILGSVAMTILAGNAWPLVPLVLLVVVLLAKTTVEERALSLMFPDYPEYRRRVRHRFLPFLI